VLFWIGVASTGELGVAMGCELALADVLAETEVDVGAPCAGVDRPEAAGEGLTCVGCTVVGAECTDRESRRAFERGIMATGARGDVDNGEALSDWERGGGGGIVRDISTRRNFGTQEMRSWR